MPALTTPTGVTLVIDWDGESGLWAASEPGKVGGVAAEDRFLEGALMDLLGYQVAHDGPPEWLPAFVDEARAAIKR